MKPLTTGVLFGFIVFMFLFAGCTSQDVGRNSSSLSDNASFESYSLCVESCKTCEQQCEDRLYDQLNQCENIKNDYTKKSCEDKINYAEALETNDRTYCEKIDEPDKTACIINVHTAQAIVYDDPGKCTALGRLNTNAMGESVNSTVYITICEDRYYYELAKSTKNNSFCEKIQINNQMKESCQSQ